MDIRLKTTEFPFSGRTYVLRCNMNVLADVQEAYGGSFNAALSSKGTLRTVNTFLAAMLNDYADEQGWPERYTAADLGRMLDPSMTALAERNQIVMDLVRSALTPESPEGAAEKN